VKLPRFTVASGGAKSVRQDHRLEFAGEANAFLYLLAGSATEIIADLNG